jgi:hypothetical protein
VLPWGTSQNASGAGVPAFRADETVPFADSEELVRNSGLPPDVLIEVGTEHRLADEELPRMTLRAVEETG